jgi:hypothetical protein
MIFVFLLLIFFVVVPLAINSRHLLRILLLALGIEFLKKFVFLVFADTLLSSSSGTGSQLVLAAMLIAQLPELLISHSHEPISIGLKVTAYVGGIIWNLVPAFLISFCWPENVDRVKFEAVKSMNTST